MPVPYRQRRPQDHLRRASQDSGIRDAFMLGVKTFAHPNTRKGVLAFFDNRITWGMFCHWKKGRRNIAPWAIEIVRVRAEALMQAISEIEVGPGREVGKYNLPTMRGRPEAIEYRKQRALKEKARLQTGLDSRPLIEKR